MVYKYDLSYFYFICLFNYLNVKLVTSQKLIKVFLFYEKYYIVYTLNFQIRVNVNFCKKNLQLPLTLNVIFQRSLKKNSVSPY